MTETTPNWRKNTFLFLSSQTLSLFGSSLVQYAILWYITLGTESGMMMTIYILFGFVPTFLLSPFAGVWADRYNRKLLIMLSDSFIALSTLILAMFFLMGFESLWMIFAITVVRSLGNGIQTPAIGSFLPLIVPAEKLTRVNAAYSSIQSFVMLASPMLSGALLMMTTIEIIFFIDVITATIAVFILLFFLKVRTHAKAAKRQVTGYFADLKEGIRYVGHHEYLKRFFLFSALFMILAAPVSFLTPLQVARTFGGDVWRLTAIEVVFSIGMLAGGLIMGTWGGFKNKVHTMVLSNFMFAACTFALGITPIFWLYLLVMGISGIAMPMFNTPSMVLLQEKVEENVMGRVFGVFSMIATSMMPFGMLLFGPMADFVPIEWLLIGTGLALLVMSTFMLKNKALVQAGMPVRAGEQ